MEVTVPKKELLRLVTRMQSVAERKSTMPILSSVLLTTEGTNSVRLSATDLYLGLVGKVSGEVTKQGTVAVPAKDLFERIKMMPEGPIQISSPDASATTLKAKGSARRYTLRGMPGGDFPPLQVPQEGAPTLSLDVGVLRELIEKTYFSISTDETRAHLNSALLEWDGNIVRMVTTDGHRLSKMEIMLSDKHASDAMLIPQKAILELRGLCDEIAQEVGKDAQIRITQSGSSAFFQAGNLLFSVKLVDAKFPPYAQVIPQNQDKVVKAPRLDLANALKAVSVAANERTGGVRLAVNPGVIRITSESPDTGDGFDELVVDYQGGPITIGFNAKYFLDVLAALTDEEVALSLSGDLDPAVLRSASPKEGRDFLAVVMPMRI
jgi:DNA polymerase III subunit beta